MTPPLLILDWDDTLFPTTYCDTHHLSLKSTPQDIIPFLPALQKHSTTLVSLFKYAIPRARVRIVTNAGLDWVYLSCSKFLPDLSSILDTLPIISACDIYSSRYPNKPYSWKHHTFNVLIIDSDTNVISIGDSWVERNVTREITRLRNTPCKTLKYIDKPSLEDLTWELVKTLEYLPYLFDTMKDVSIEVRPPDTAPLILL
ncbi:MAG: hypothetical protein WC208_13880 [Gallionella sp.]|jgi:hypothetical protein